MGRYIVVEIDDNKEAARWVEQLELDARDSIARGQLIRVVGIFVRPGETCSCWDWSTINYRDPTKSKNAGGVTRGEKFGWWVCSRCGKPRKAGHQLVNRLLPSQTLEIHPKDAEYEFTVEGLSIGSIYRENIPRPKANRLKRILKEYRKKHG